MDAMENTIEHTDIETTLNKKINNSKIDLNTGETVEKVETVDKMSYNECMELQNIKYKTMFQKNKNGRKPQPATSTISSIESIHSFLAEERNQSATSTKPWSKLDKMSKMKKINDYIEMITPKEQLTDKEQQDLKIYLRTCLDRKQLTRVKDVEYDLSMGKIKNIYGLTFIKKNEKGEKRFTLKQVDKKNSTLRNLGKGKKTKREKNSVNENINEL
jgi:hypothetical protein